MTCCAGGVGGGGGGGKGTGKCLALSFEELCMFFIYLFFVRSIFYFFFTPTPAVITNLIPRRMNELSQGWHHGVTVARLPQQMRCDQGEVMISPAEPSMLLSL